MRQARAFNPAAMKLEADAKIPFSQELVFTTYRDRLPELVPYLPDIKRITVKSRDDEGVITKILNEWEASTEIPKVAQSIVKPEMLEWLDHATWNADDKTVEWRIETKMFTQNVRCQGKNTVIADGDHAIFRLRGDLEVDLKGIPGVPRFLAGKVTPHVEKFVVQLLTPNLLAVASGVEQFLTAEAAKG